MKTSPLVFSLFGGVMLLICAAARAQDMGYPNLDGTWESETEGVVQIRQIDDYVWIEASEPCSNGGPRPFILSGHLQGNNILRGIMWRCTEPELVTNCGHPKTYSIQFTAQVHDKLFFRDQIQMLLLQIKCDYEMEIWNKDDCKCDHKEPRLDFLAGSLKALLETPTPAPPITSRTDCSRFARDSCEWSHCTLWGWGVDPWPEGTCGSR